jgi:hypothetical protein
MPCTPREYPIMSRQAGFGINPVPHNVATDFIECRFKDPMLNKSPDSDSSNRCYYNPPDPATYPTISGCHSTPNSTSGVEDVEDGLRLLNERYFRMNFRPPSVFPYCELSQYRSGVSTVYHDQFKLVWIVAQIIVPLTTRRIQTMSNRGSF